ncbi:MAG: hypothetical protein EOO56_03850 [Hymenobacter sp.]|nr:MAG: hypothetical protein EOO56_03850 [Hymenobacter sp.]
MKTTCIRRIFYAKVNNVNRYRLRTNQQAAGKLGGTVLAILAEVLRHDSQACFGFIAAAMLDETSDVSTKRFRMYKYMLEQKVNPQRYTVITIPGQSRIFVMPVHKARNLLVRKEIINRYESIFHETF